MSINVKDWFKTISVVVAFCCALFLGAIKSIVFGPVAALILIVGNVGVILGLFPAHVVWTINALFKTHRLDPLLKVAIFIGLPVLFSIWLGLSIASSVLVGLGYGFFTPWVSTFEAFRYDDVSHRFYHCIGDGTWTTIKGSCTVVRDFMDVCLYSYRRLLKELRNSPASEGHQTLSLLHVPACIVVGLMGLIVEIPLYTAIAIVKSPFMLFKGWQRLIHDMISREGPFLETACIPIAGLTIIFWPLVVIGSVVMAIFSSFFIGLYASVIVYQERSFRRGVAFVVAMVAAFDEYSNDWLYLREGSILPKPRYRKKRPTDAPELSTILNPSIRFSAVLAEAPGMIMPTLTTSRSVREVIHEVKMVQVWGHMMKSCDMKGQELLDANVLTLTDLQDWLKGKNSTDLAIVDVGVLCYSFIHFLLYSIKSGSEGLLLDDIEVTYLNRPQDRMAEWFFHPIMVLKEQIKTMQLEEGEIRYLEKVVVFGSNPQRMKAWENGCSPPQDSVRAAQIEGLSRRMIGMMRSISMLPTFRRKYRQIVKGLIVYSTEKEGSKAETYSLTKVGSTRSVSNSSVGSIEIV
ncbi:hypothetical protein LIER_30340 [Lithospermum erythrorhizon]|uniref:Uncharacterized protein n=1 Tax=Lithospermum erythrorhizon TaxID=34254 RepID=A0AAV3RSI7_LITER